jgi:hypothetical protein
VLATSAMSYDYDERQVWVGELTLPHVPGASYAMCDDHAERLVPPQGWMLTDRRRAGRSLILALEVA